jgi:hypothetical protein
MQPQSRFNYCWRNPALNGRQRQSVYLFSFEDPQSGSPSRCDQQPLVAPAFIISGRLCLCRRSSSLGPPATPSATVKPSQLLVFLLVHYKSIRGYKTGVTSKTLIHMAVAGPINVAGVLGIPALLAFSSTNETDAKAGFWRVRVTRLFGCPAEVNRAAQMKF